MLELLKMLGGGNFSSLFNQPSFQNQNYQNQNVQSQSSQNIQNQNINNAYNNYPFEAFSAPPNNSNNNMANNNFDQNNMMPLLMSLLNKNGGGLSEIFSSKPKEKERENISPSSGDEILL